MWYNNESVSPKVLHGLHPPYSILDMSAISPLDDDDEDQDQDQDDDNEDDDDDMMVVVNVF